MGRRPTIDRERVLSVAENIVSTRGAAALTVEAVATAAGITKGGVQSCFGNKESLITAMLERWLQGYNERLASRTGGTPARARRIQAHTSLTFEDTHDGQRAATLMAALFQSPEKLQIIRGWYDELTAEVYESTPDSQRLRLALLATEGAFFLRYLGLSDMNDERWKIIGEDIRGLLEGGQKSIS